jgi:hypothetical protein
MKNFINLSVLLSIIMFVSSCGSRLTIEKRQHSKGYYVAHNNIKQTFSSEPYKTVKTSLIEHENTKNVNQSIVDTTIANTIKANVEIVQSNPNEKIAVVEEIEITTPTTSDNKIEDNSDTNPRTIKSANNKVKTILSKNSIESEVHSLLWIVIIVLLVLWALGLIGGLGASGLIHILLVIALILLILWLLRVI